MNGIKTYKHDKTPEFQYSGLSCFNIKRSKPKNFFLLILICFLLPYISINANESQKDDIPIEIQVYNDVSIGEVIRGSSKKILWDNKIIKFEIKCNSKKNIRITKVHDVKKNGFKIETEWKLGPYTGFENEFSNGVYTPVDGKYYVTVKIQSIEVQKNIQHGNYVFQPEISVEYVD